MIAHPIIIALVFGGQVPGLTYAGRTKDGPVTYTVTSSGNDSNYCSSGSTPCLTPQAAINYAPHGLRHLVTVSIGCGTFPGFYVEGFWTEPNFSGTGGLIIQGTRVPSTPTTGTATGTVTSCIGGGTPDPNTKASITDNSQSWTAHDANLRGRKLCLTTGAGVGQCNAIADNTSTTITLAGYWNDFHAGWHNCTNGDAYAITDPCTHINTSISLPAGPEGGPGGGQPAYANIAAIIVSNLRGGSSGSFGNDQPADNYQFEIKDLDFVDPVHSAVVVDTADHIGLRFLSAGMSGIGLSSGAALFQFRNSVPFTVQSSFMNCTGHSNTVTGTMIGVSDTATPDTQIGLYGNVQGPYTAPMSTSDECQAYFSDSNLNTTESHSSIYFDGEDIRNLKADNPSGHFAAIQIISGTQVHFVGTTIATVNGGNCIILGDSRWKGVGIADFEGGDFGGCVIGMSLRGAWRAMFINVPTVSNIGGTNTRFGIEAAGGAQVYGLNLAYNSGTNPLTGSLGDLTFENGQTTISYTQVNAAQGQTITEPQRGGVFSYGNGEATSATMQEPANWMDYTAAEVWGSTVKSGTSYTMDATSLKTDRVIMMSGDSTRTVTVQCTAVGRHIVVVDTSASVTAGHTITITPASGAVWYSGATHATYVITPGSSSGVELLADGTNCQAISRF